MKVVVNNKIINLNDIMVSKVTNNTIQITYFTDRELNSIEKEKIAINLEKRLNNSNCNKCKQIT